VRPRSANQGTRPAVIAPIQQHAPCRIPCLLDSGRRGGRLGVLHHDCPAVAVDST